MKVQIVSMQAVLHGRASIMWEGEIEVELGQTDAAYLVRLFRLFNRVTEQDVELLERMGYRLPSLSVGDLVHMNCATWRVEAVGWTRLTQNDEFARELMLR